MSSRLLYVITKSELGGAQVHLLELVRAFRKEFAVHLAVGAEGFLADRARELGVDVTVLDSLVQPVDPYRDWRALGELTALVGRLRPDVIHAHSSKAGTIARLVARRHRIRSIFTIHGWAFANGVSLRRKLLALPTEALLGPLTSRFIVVSHADRDLALRYRVGRPEQMRVIHNGVPDSPWRADPGVGEPVRLVMVGRFAPQKAQAQVLDALRGLRDRPWEAWFVGDGPTLPTVKQRASESGLEGRVRFWGEQHDVAQLLARCHVFVLASNWEGLPMTILEAMRAGLPVVASDVGGVREAVVDGVTGFLVPRGQVDILRDRLARLNESPELRVRMGRAARVRYEQEFTIERMIVATRKVYEEVLGPRA